MKLSLPSHPWKGLAALAAIIACSHGPSSANSLIAGGWVPERHTLGISPMISDPPSPQGVATEVAIIEIENNLPEYELVLEFPDNAGGSASISEVRLDGLDGILGCGLTAPMGLRMENEGASGRFRWRPGRQASATVGYRVRATVTYKLPRMGSQQLLVSMPITY
jgi:hypothetical protein